MAVTGQVGMWVAVGLASGVAVVAVTGVDWVLLAAVALTVESVVAGVYVEKRKWESAAWVAVVSGLGAVAAFGEVVGSSTDTFIVAGFVSGVVLVGVSVVLDVFRDTDRAGIWWRPMAVTGQAALVASIGFALASWTLTDAMLLVAGFSLFEAAVLGLYAIHRERAEFAWASSAAFGVAAASGFLGFNLSDTEMAASSLVIGSVILLMWTFFMRTSETSSRIAMWLWPGFVLAEIALAFGGVVLLVVTAQPVGSFAVAAVLAVNALAIGIVASARQLQILAMASAGFGAAAYVVALYGFEPAPVGATVGIWFGTVTFGLAAAWLSRQTGDLARMWANAAALVLPIGVVGMSAQAVAIEGDLMLAGLAAASLTASGLIWLNEGILEPLLVDETESQGRDSKMLASIFLVAGMGLLAASYPSETWSLAPLVATAGLGIVGAWMWSTDETRRAALTSWIGLSTVAQLGAIWLFGAVSPQSSAVLAMNSVSFLAVGILGVRHRIAVVGVVGLIVALAGLAEDTFGLATHTVIVLVAVAVLVVLESERLLRKHEGREYTDIFRILEWMAISAPLILAALEMLDDLNFGLLLVVEGVVLMIWGFESRVRRRMLVGLVGIVTAITIGVVIPIVSGAREGFGSGGWLIIGAVMAVVLIAVGSNISRYRTSFGRHVDRLGSILEEWE